MRVYKKSWRIKLMNISDAQRIVIFQSRLGSSYPLVISQWIYHKSSFKIVFLKVCSAKRITRGPPGVCPNGQSHGEWLPVLVTGVAPVRVTDTRYGDSRPISSTSLPGGYNYFRNILVNLTDYVENKTEHVICLLLVFESWWEELLHSSQVTCKERAKP